MSAKIIDGKKISAEIKEEARVRAEELIESGITPTLAVIQVGNDPASSVYIGNKRKACDFVGIKFMHFHLADDVRQEEVEMLIESLNSTASVHGILVQLPLPDHLNEKEITNLISPEKDVDGFHPVNVGKLSIGDEGLVSCTPAGIIQLLKRSNIEIDGKECVVVGRSNIVGKPTAVMMLRENATVTVCHSHTKNLKEICRRADILIAAIGKSKFFDSSYVKDGSVVIDVGIHRDESGKLSGDVDFDDVFDKVSAITPVPGGVGAMTVAMLMHNSVLAAEMQIQ